MRRTRFEMLEARKMFSVTDLIIDPFHVESAVVRSLDGTQIGALEFVAQSRTESVDNDETITVHGEPTALPDGADDGLLAPAESMLLPYIEQGNVYQFAQGARMAEFTDGTSNTMMFGENATFKPRLPDGRRDSLDADSPGPTDVPSNGIIAVLIGLAVDPSDRSGNASNPVEDAQAVPTASLLSSDEYFSRFANSALDNEAAVALSNDRWDGGGFSQVTHDQEFEAWGIIAARHGGYAIRDLADVLVSS